MRTTNQEERRATQTDLALLIYRLASTLDNLQDLSDAQLARLTYKVALWYEDVRSVQKGDNL